MRIVCSCVIALLLAYGVCVADESDAGFRKRLQRQLIEAKPGDVVLDLACGTGDTGFLVARSIGPDGKVLATDFSHQMLDRARQNGDEQGIENVEYRVLDAERMDLPDDSVDGVVCRFGYMLMGDPVQALRETRRVLRDGGRVTFAVWAPPEENVWAALPAGELIQRGHIPPPEPGDPGIFALADPARIADSLGQAGFADHAVEQVAFDWNYEGPEQHWDLTIKLAGPLADAIEGIPEPEREEIREAVGKKIGAILEQRGSVSALVHVVTAS